MRLWQLQMIHSTIPKKHRQMVEQHIQTATLGASTPPCTARIASARRSAAAPCSASSSACSFACHKSKCQLRGGRRGVKAHGFSLDVRLCEYAVCGLGRHGTRAEGGLVEDVVHPVVVALVAREREGARGDLVDLVCRCGVSGVGVVRGWVGEAYRRNRRPRACVVVEGAARRKTVLVGERREGR